MVAQIKLIYPDKLTSEQEELLEKLHESFGHENAPHKGLFEEVYDKVKGWFS